jgi:preprotein translocase subunit YajC
VIGGRHFLRLGHYRRAFEEEFSNPMTTTTILAAAAPSGGASFFIQTIPLVLIFVIFWFLLIRPQQKRMKDHQAQIASVKKGDRVVTGGGLIGKVTKVGDTEVEIELAQGVRVQAVKSTLSQVGVAATPAND